MHLVRPARDELAHGRRALGHPGALVEQLRSLEEGRQIHLDEPGAQSAAEPLRLTERGRRPCIAQKEAVRRARHPDAQGRRHCGHRSRGTRPECPRERIALVGARHDLQRNERILDGQSEDRHAIEGAAGGHHARRRDEPQGRLEADDVVECRRDATRAGRVGAQGQRHDAPRYGHRRPRARTARNEVGTQRVARDAVGRPDAHEPGGELIEVGLADDECAGLPEARNRGGVLAGRIRERGAACRSRQARHVDVVLDGDRYPIERQVPVAPRFQLRCIGEH